MRRQATFAKLGEKRYRLMMLELRDTSINYGGAPLFAPLDLRIARREIAVIIAPSGMGKSSLLRWVAGLPSPHMTAHGTITLNGRDITQIPPESRRIGLIFQTPLLFPHMSVGDNLAFALPATLPANERQARIAEALGRAGLDGMQSRDPATLSGGQSARIALLRTLLAEPEALLLDEPFASLDGAMRAQMLALVQGESQRLNLPVLLVSHDPRDHNLGDRPPLMLKVAE